MRSLALSGMRRPFTVLVEGNIGSGKSRFLNRFQNMPNVDILQEYHPTAQYFINKRYLRVVRFALAVNFVSWIRSAK